jgi:hypothetical protein
MAKTHGSGEFSVTEENARQGDTGPTEASPAGEPDRPPVPAAPSQPTASPPASIPVPPHPSTPPPVPPVDREDSREESRNPSGAKRTALGVGGAGLSGIGKMLAQQAALLGGWVRRQGLPRVAGAVAGLAVLGLLIWWVSSSLGGGARPAAGEASPAATTSSAPAARGALPLEAVGALDFRLGDCFKDFDPEAPQSTVVDCGTGHSAQLIAIETYPAPDSYPGRDPLKQKALDACKGAPLTEKSAEYVLSYKLAYPSSTSWDNGDRRVDCYVVADTGNAIMESLLP